MSWSGAAACERGTGVDTQHAARHLQKALDNHVAPAQMHVCAPFTVCRKLDDLLLEDGIPLQEQTAQD